MLPFGATSTAFELGLISWTVVTVVVCAGIPLTTGIAKGHVAMGIIAALITLPIAAVPALGCVPGLIAGCVSSTIISIIPVARKPLLSQAEIEAETRRARGY